MKKFYYIFLICILFLSLAACGSPGANDFSANYSSLPPEEWVWYEEGEYEAGIDISAGEYYIKENGDGTCWAEIINGEETQNVSCYDFSFFYLEQGDILRLEKGKITQARNVPPISGRGSGMYRIGFDLPAGNYQVVPTGEEEAYYRVFANAKYLRKGDAAFSSSVTSLQFHVSEGQYLMVLDAKIEEIPPVEEEGKEWNITGMYQVGRDIQPGEYYFQAFSQDESNPQYSAFQIFQEPVFEVELLVSGSSLDPFGFLTVEEGDYLLIQHGKIAPASQIGPIEAVGDGMYRVGTDLPVGECKLRPIDEEGGFYVLFEDLSPESVKEWEGTTVTEETTLSLKKGQYLMLQNLEVVK